MMGQAGPGELGTNRGGDIDETVVLVCRPLKIDTRKVPLSHRAHAVAGGPGLITTQGVPDPMET